MPDHRPRKDASDHGEEYLESLSLTERRRGGLVYTPRHLVKYVLDVAGYVSDAAIEGASLLDPACGAGVFLEEALRCLATRIAGLQGDLRFPHAAGVLLDVARRNLVGVDVDPEACVLARAALVRTAAELTGRPVALDYFDSNIIEGDFLGTGLVSPGGRLAVLPPFAVIVGNPPYVTTTRLDAMAKVELRRRFLTATGRIDLYVLFFERAVTFLRMGGRLAFITPDKYLSSHSARPLRHLLRASGAVQMLSRFESHRVFRDVATVPCVTLFERGTPQGTVELVRCAREPSNSGSVQVIGRSHLSSSLIAGDDWAAVSPKIQRLGARIRGMHPTLAGLSRRVSAGLATGRDAVFVIPANADHGIEPELLHAAIRGRDITRFSIGNSNLRVLLPYDFTSRTPALIDIRRYPGARRYLALHREELEARHCVRVWGKAWYDLHDPVPFHLRTSRKVLVPDVADRNRFAFDPGALVPLHSAYYMLPEGIDPRFLTTVLNSRPIEFLIRTTAPRIKDGFSRYRSQFLLSLPIPAAKERVMRQVLRAYDDGDFGDAAEQAAALFGLSPREYAVLDAVLSELRAPA
jgi:adenine-specific DNA-methyltransferase